MRVLMWTLLVLPGALGLILALSLVWTPPRSTDLFTTIPSSSLHSFVLSALFYGSPVPGEMLSCCAQAGLAAVSSHVGLQSSSACVPSQGRKVPLVSLISIGLHPARRKVRS